MKSLRDVISFALVAGALAGCDWINGPGPQTSIYSEDFRPLPAPVGTPSNPIPWRDPAFKTTIVGWVVAWQPFLPKSLGGECVVGTPINQPTFGTINSSYDVSSDAGARANIDAWLNIKINANIVKSVTITAEDGQTDTLLNGSRNEAPRSCFLTADQLTNYAAIVAAHSASNFKAQFITKDNEALDLSSGTKVSQALGGQIGITGNNSGSRTFAFTSPSKTRVFYEVLTRSPVPQLIDTPHGPGGKDDPLRLGEGNKYTTPFQRPVDQFYLIEANTPGTYSLHLIGPGTVPVEKSVVAGVWTPVVYRQVNYYVRVFNRHNNNYGISFIGS